MPIFRCPKKCCSFEISSYFHEVYMAERTKYHSRKAGVVLFDPNTQKVLLVQSCGHLWGPPKGTLQYGESQRQCAVREVREETGLEVDSDSFIQAVNLFNKAIYFYIEMPQCKVRIQNQIPHNDANGIGWVNLNCLDECIQNGNISLSKHCQIVFKKLFNRTFKHPVFTTVTSGGNKK